MKPSEVVALVLGAIGTIAGILQAYCAWVVHRRAYGRLARVRARTSDTRAEHHLTVLGDIRPVRPPKRVESKQEDVAQKKTAEHLIEIYTEQDMERLIAYEEARHTGADLPLTYRKSRLGDDPLTGSYLPPPTGDLHITVPRMRMERSASGSLLLNTLGTYARIIKWVALVAAAVIGAWILIF
jgi:hypothetical protein